MRTRSRILILVLAVVCGLTAAYVTMRLLDERVAALERTWMIVSIEDASTGVRITLDDGRRLVVDTTSAENARAIALFYRGKTVAVRPEDGCTRIFALLQLERRVLEDSAYARLRGLGLRDGELAVAYTLPPGVTASLRGDGLRSPAVCATEA